MTKTYTNRSNARRAGVAAGIAEDQLEITVHKVAGEKPRFGFKQKETQAAAPVRAATAAKRATPAKVPAAPREQRAGIVRPRAGGLCASVWEHLDRHPESTLADAKAVAIKRGWNVNNLVCEFYRWRKYTAPIAKKAA